MKIQTLMLLLALWGGTAAAAPEKAKPRVIAHRGHWQYESSAQNSISSLRNAIAIGAWGSEFDVLLTSDSVLVVCHGPEHDGRTVEETPYATVKESLLANGETLPTLEAYLAAGRKAKRTRLVLEIKSLSTPEKESQAVRQVLETVKRLKAEKQVEYIAFSRHVVEEMLRLAPEAPIAYLNGDLTPAELKEMGCSGLDYHYSLIQAHPEWVEQAHDLGLTVNVWTVDRPEVMQEMIDRGVDFITTNRPAELQALLEGKDAR